MPDFLYMPELINMTDILSEIDDECRTISECAYTHGRHQEAVRAYTQHVACVLNHLYARIQTLEDEVQRLKS